MEQRKKTELERMADRLEAMSEECAENEYHLFRAALWALQGVRHNCAGNYKQARASADMAAMKVRDFLAGCA